MQVIYGLSAIRSVVDDDPVAVGQPHLRCYPFGGQHQVSQQGMILGFGVRQLGDRLFGDDQNMHRSLGMDIPKGDRQIVFVNNIRWNFLADNFAKNGFAHTRGEMKR